MGLVLVGGIALDRRATASARVTLLATGTCVATLGVTQLIGAAGVLTGEQRDSPLAGTSAWVDAPVWVLALLVAAGCAALAVALLAGTPRGTPVRQGQDSTVT